MKDLNQNYFEKADNTAICNSSENPEDPKPAKRGVTKPSDSEPTEKTTGAKEIKRPIKKPNENT